MVPNDETVAPFSTSQFQPPSASCSPSSRSTSGRHVHAEVRARRDDVAVDARLDLALEEPMVCPRGLEVGIPPGGVLPDKADGATRLVALGIEPQPAQELEHVEGVGEIARPRPATPLAVGRLEREQPGAPALGRDPRPLGGDDVRRLVGQVAHHLPADRGIGVEQPSDDRHAVRYRYAPPPIPVVPSDMTAEIMPNTLLSGSSR